VTRFAETLVAVLEEDGLDLVGVVDVAQELLRIAGERALEYRHSRCPKA
jgi:hypothetical protein